MFGGAYKRGAAVSSLGFFFPEKSRMQALLGKGVEGGEEEASFLRNGSRDIYMKLFISRLSSFILPAKTVSLGWFVCSGIVSLYFFLFPKILRHGSDDYSSWIL